MTVSSLAEPVPLGIALGLFAGKQLGVFLASAAVIRLGWARLPSGASWKQVYGVAMLCGIGFTMSLFVGLLAFPDAIALQNELKLGVLLGSVSSAIFGAVLLRAPATKDAQRSNKRTSRDQGTVVHGASQ